MYDGIQIDMINVGNADSFLVTRYTNGATTRVLVDGGRGGDYPTVREFLKGLGVTHLDHVVASHVHEDHTGGLVELVQNGEFTIGTLWAHEPAAHANVNAMRSNLQKMMAFNAARSEKVQKSLNTIDDLLNAARKHGLTIREPFSGDVIGPLQVLGPSKEFYEKMLRGYESLDQLATLDASLVTMAKADEEEDGLLDEPVTSPENNSSTILAAVWNNRVLMLTADAGVQAFDDMLTRWNVEGTLWMQIPHHGSRRNVNERLIKHFRPETAYVSAEGSKKHPRQAVVDAFKANGARVYSTHYTPPGGNKLHSQGTVPARSGYSPALPL